MRKFYTILIVCLIVLPTLVFASTDCEKSPVSRSKQTPDWLDDPVEEVEEDEEDEEDEEENSGSNDIYVPLVEVYVAPTPKVSLPDGNTSWEHGVRNRRVEWDGLEGSLVKIELYRGDDLVGSFADWDSNDGYEVRSATVSPSWGSGIDFRIKVEDNLRNYLWSDWFQISAPIDVSYPNSATRWSTNQPGPTLAWSGAEGTTVRIELYQGTQLIEVLASNTPNLGTWEYNGVVPARWGTGSNYLILISDNLQNTYPSERFSIDPIYISNPTEGYIWYKGRIPPAIEWVGGSTVVQVDLYRGSTFVRHLTDSWIDNRNQLNLTQPTQGGWTESPLYRVKVTSLNQSNNTIVGWSEYFEVRISNDVVAGAELFFTQISSELARPSDIDYWKFTAENNFIYDFNVNSTTQIKIEVMDSAGSRVLDTDGNSGDMNWYCHRSGTYYVRVVALNGTSTGTYTLDLRKKLPPENQRHFSLAATFGKPVSELSDVITSGYGASFAYLPIRYAEIGAQFMSVTVDKETITDDDALTLNYLGGFIGARTPELFRISLRGGIGYQGKISDSEVYLRHEYIDYLNSLNNGMRPYYGVDYKMVFNHYGTALFLRLEQVLTQGSMGITSIGVNFAF